MSPNTPQIPPQAPRQIEVLAFPDVQLLDVAGPVQVFAAANEQADGPGALPPYRIRLIAPEGARSGRRPDWRSWPSRCRTWPSRSTR